MALNSKRQNYAKLVMETHRPTVSKKKVEEMKIIKEQLNMPANLLI